MKLKTFKFNLLYLSIFIVFSLLSSFLMSNPTNYLKQTTNEHFTILLISTLVKIIFGILLALEFFLKQKKLRGPWKIDKFKVLFLVLPSLILSIYPLLYISSISFLPKYLEEFILNNTNSTITSFFSIILGHSLMTSFYKR